MLIADADHDNKIVENVLALQRRCRVGLADLESVLARIDGGGADPATEGLERRIQETEREMQNLLEQLEDAQAALQKREVSAFAHCSRSRSEIAPQHKSIGLVGARCILAFAEGIFCDQADNVSERSLRTCALRSHNAIM